MPTALGIVKQFFPQVEDVKDAKHPLLVEVTKNDNKSAKVRDHKACAMAVACKRAEKADGVIVSVMTAYVIKGNTATRYRLPQSVSREVVSFDREAGFEPGEYTMSPPVPTSRLGSMRGTGVHTGTGKKITRVHRTSRIRTVLGTRLQ
jgi:hypothetical protein